MRKVSLFSRWVPWTYCLTIRLPPFILSCREILPFSIFFRRGSTGAIKGEPTVGEVQCINASFLPWPRRTLIHLSAPYVGRYQLNSSQKFPEEETMAPSSAPPTPTRIVCLAVNVEQIEKKENVGLLKSLSAWKEQEISHPRPAPILETKHKRKKRLDSLQDLAPSCVTLRESLNLGNFNCLICNTRDALMLSTEWWLIAKWNGDVKGKVIDPQESAAQMSDEWARRPPDIAPTGKGESHQLFQPGIPQVVHMEGHPGGAINNHASNRHIVALPLYLRKLR